jgi:hypothetical protein
MGRQNRPWHLIGQEGSLSLDSCRASRMPITEGVGPLATLPLALSHLA